ncbi:MAG: hypothetical protein NZ534_03930, partial [Bacteroidia bacterium]|nr:hypothetical protein [Bacteroidia bacterium]
MVVVVWAIASCAWAQTPAGDANGGAKIAKISPPCVGCVEIVERRTQNGKVFRDPADARTLYFQSFAGPVHIRDHDGVWREPDPRFVFQSGKWVCKRTFLPLSFEPHSGAAWILPDGAELRLNARNRVVAVRADGVEISEVLNLSGATVEGTRITVAEAAPGVNIISEAQAFGLKTNYELLVPPDPQIAVWAVEEAIPLPPGYRIAFDEHAQTTYLGRLGEVVLYDPAGNEAARWERPKIFDSAPERDESRRAELIAAALRAGLEQTPYAYTLKVENDTARLRLVVDARLLRLPQVRYPVVVDPQVTVAYASTTVLGVGQNMTCSIPLVYTVPGGYSVVNVVNDMFRYQATGLCCGFDFLGICLGTQCSFNGVRARVSGPCGQAEGFCNSPGQGSCTLTGDVPFVADCVVGQCNDYTIELRAHLVSQTACGGTSCAATDCFRMNAGDVAFTLVARSVETTAATDVAPLVGVPPTAQVCAETPFRLVGLPAYGVPPYTFEWFLPDGTVLADSMPELVLYENTPITLIAYDACGASEPFSFTILVLAPPAFSETITMPTCGVDNGSIALTNLPPGATINWSDGSNQPTRTGLAPGTYTVVVDDGTCSKTKQYLLEAAAEAVNLNLQIVPPNCQNPVGGTIVVSAQGNFGPYQYAVVSQQGQLPDFQSSPTFTGLGAGTYTLRVLDVNGCVYVHPEPVVFSVPEPIEVNEIATVADACFGAYTGAVVLNGVTGGTGDFQFSLSGGPWQGSPAFTGLGAGVYGLRIRDGGGCEYSTTVVVPRSAPMTLNTSVV